MIYHTEAYAFKITPIANWPHLYLLLCTSLGRAGIKCSLIVDQWEL